MSNTNGNSTGSHHLPVQAGQGPSGGDVGKFIFKAFCYGLGFAAGTAIGGPAGGVVVAMLVGGHDGGADDGGSAVT
jgi:hypothetical protein